MPLDLQKVKNCTSATRGNARELCSVVDEVPYELALVVVVADAVEELDVDGVVL